MSGDILGTINTRQTSQSERAKPEQVLNAAGGYVYQAGDEIRLARFLTLGTDGGTYYTDAKALTRENAQVVFREVARDGVGTVAKIVEISSAGRAPKNKQALFALAIAASHGDDETRRAARAVLPQVARTATHLFEFMGYAEQFRGWGYGMRNAISRWFTEREIDKLAYQVLKYRQRDGVTHWDALRLAHPYGDVEHNALFNWICTTYATKNEKSPRFGREANVDRDGHLMDAGLPEIIEAFEELQHPDTQVGRVYNTIRQGLGISWEMIPDRFINDPGVWECLIEQGVPQTALMRQLPRLTRIGLATGNVGRKIAAQLQDTEKLKRGRVHPINVLVAQRTYASGASAMGSSSWTPVSTFTDALDAAFYNAFGAVEPANKRTLIALDVSGSMGSKVSGLPISCREASGALAMVIAATEPHTEIVGFTSSRGGSYYYAGSGYSRIKPANDLGNGLSRLDISPRRRMDDNLRAIANLPFGGTDCALPLVWAAQKRQDFETVQVITDGETWAGNIHVDQALERYRQVIGHEVRMQVVAMTANGTSLCNPLDPGSLDVSGFDSTVPNLLSDHSAGRV